MINSYLNYLKASRKSENTIKNYCLYIDRFLELTGKDETEITYLDIVDYQASIGNLSANSIRLQVSAIKSYFKFLTSAHVISENPALNIEKPKANPKVKPHMSEEDVEAMIENANTVRDIAMIKFLISTGVRISELSNITIADYRKAMEYNRQIEIMGKGAKRRSIYIGKSVEEAVDRYLTTRDDDCPYLFATYRGTKVDTESFGKTLKATAKRAGLPYWKEVCNHCMRAGFATIANEKGVNVATISKAMGHSSIAVTSVYIRTVQNNINDAMEMMSF